MVLIMKLKRGYFITFEGGDGAGKTTLIDHLEKSLLAKGYPVIKTREPGGSALGEMIRGWLLNRDLSLAITAQAELLLFLAGRAQHLEEVIRPGLSSGKVILCDRFNDSTIAYQGVARGLSREYVTQICNLVCGPTIPHLTFFLDLDPIEGLNRSKRVKKEHAAAGESDRMESEALPFHQKVHQAMRRLAEENPERICTLDAAQPAERVFHEASIRLEEVLRL